MRRAPSFLAIVGMLLVAVAAPAAPAEKSPSTDDLLAQARAAHEAKDWPAFHEATKKAYELEPRSLTFTYNMACAEALLGHDEDAVGFLLKLLERNVDLGIEKDADLERLRSSPAFAPVRQALARLRAPITSSEVAFTLPEKDLLTEGIAYDPETKSFFVSSVHQRKILRRAADGTVSDFIPPAFQGIDAVLALRVDPKRRILWACTAAMPEMEGYDPRSAGRSTLVAFDLAAEKPTVKKRITITDGKKHDINDLVIDGAGAVYFSDPVGGAVYRVRPGGDRAETFVSPGTIRSPQGLALSADERRLFVADYAGPILTLDLRSGKTTKLEPPPSATFAGTDGLVFFEGRLYGIQNGIEPHRVFRVELDPAGTKVKGVTILEMNNPAFAEPTLGVVVDGWLHYVANSQWSAFARPPQADELAQPVILKTRLK